MKGKYLYGIVKKPDNQVFKIDGLSMVDFRELAAVVSEKEYKDYHSLPKEKVVKELTAHQERIERMMASLGTVLPVKFGTILKNEDQIRKVLEKGYHLLVDSLQKMADRIELDLVCFWNEQKAAQMAFQESKKIRGYYTSEVALSEVEGDSSDGGMESKIALGKLIAQYLETKKEKLSSQILRMLKKEAVKNCPHALADVNMVLNQAFLVQKENEERFNHALNIVDSQLADLVKFRLVGPLPPYSFATVIVESLEQKEVDKAKEALGVDGQLNLKKIKSAYDQLAFKFHPDHGGNPVEFERVTKSYKLLRKFAEQGLVGVYLYKWEES